MTSTNKAKTVTPLDINLNEQYHPHKEMIKAYKDAGAENLYFADIPVNINERRVFQASAASGKPLRHLITHLYRVQTKNGKEYCYMGNEIYAKDYWGNTVSHFRTLGKYEKPVFDKTVGLNPSMLRDNTDINKAMEAQTREISIDHMETVYEHEWDQVKPTLEKWKEQEIITDDSQLIVIIGTQKYSKPYTWHEWFNLDISDCELIARVGRSFQVKDKDLTPELLGKLRSKYNENMIADIGKTK